MRASTRQQEIIAHGRSDRKLLVAEGAVRSGKTAAAACAHAAYAMATAPDDDHAIVGFTSDAVLRNVVRARIGTISALKALEFDAEVSGVGGTHVRVHRAEGDTRLWVVGLADARGQDRLAGSTFASALVDEGSRIDKDSWSMLWSRLSPPQAKCWITTNPDDRRHWLKREVIDRLAIAGIGDLLSYSLRLVRGSASSSFVEFWRRRLAG